MSLLVRSRYGISHCAVCQSKLEEPIEMPCEHICCSSCARSWFADRNTCPICRQEVGGGFKVVINQECRYCQWRDSVRISVLPLLHHQRRELWI